LKSFVCRVVFVLCLQFEVLLQGFSEGFDRVFEQKAAAALKASNGTKPSQRSAVSVEIQ
jgi:hypothetical protein